MINWIGCSSWDGYLPPSLFGYLTLSECGCNILRDSQRIPAYINILEKRDQVELTDRAIMELKTALWTLVMRTAHCFILCP